MHRVYVDSPPVPAGMPAGDAGFTMVELIVAMIIFLVLGALVTRTMLDTFSYQEKAAASRTANLNAADLLDQLTNDLRSAIAPGRLQLAEAPGRNEELRNLLLFNQVPAGDTQVNPATLDDLVHASESRLEFIANVVPETGTPASECVRYDSTSAGVFREVFAGASCGGSTVSRTQLLAARPAGRTAIFRYVRMYNPTASSPTAVVDTSRCARQAPEPGPGAVNGSNYRQLREIVSVDVDVESYETRQQVGYNRITSTVNVRSRLTNLYLYAIGCTEWV